MQPSKQTKLKGKCQQIESDQYRIMIILTLASLLVDLNKMPTIKIILMLALEIMTIVVTSSERIPRVSQSARNVSRDSRRQSDLELTMWTVPATWLSQRPLTSIWAPHQVVLQWLVKQLYPLTHSAIASTRCSQERIDPVSANTSNNLTCMLSKKEDSSSLKSRKTLQLSKMRTSQG